MLFPVVFSEKPGISNEMLTTCDYRRPYVVQDLPPYTIIILSNQKAAVVRDDLIWVDYSIPYLDLRAPCNGVPGLVEAEVWPYRKLLKRMLTIVKRSEIYDPFRMSICMKNPTNPCFDRKVCFPCLHHHVAGITSGKCLKVNLSGDGLLLGLPDMGKNSSR
ncbi:hypothetical protein TNCV_2419221 [Trichonephila clavipes]|nr:hypothetical protein TNCV_2419221 [Trichonephila clavipes]